MASSTHCYDHSEGWCQKCYVQVMRLPTSFLLSLLHAFTCCNATPQRYDLPSQSGGAGHHIVTTYSSRLEAIISCNSTSDQIYIAMMPTRQWVAWKDLSVVTPLCGMPMQRFPAWQVPYAVLTPGRPYDEPQTAFILNCGSQAGTLTVCCGAALPAVSNSAVCAFIYAGGFAAGVASRGRHTSGEGCINVVRCICRSGMVAEAVVRLAQCCHTSDWCGTAIAFPCPRWRDVSSRRCVVGRCLHRRAVLASRLHDGWPEAEGRMGESGLHECARWC